jgi:hypothetical protein
MVKKIYESFVWLLITIVRGIHIKHTWNGKSALILASIGENVSAHLYSILIFAGCPVTQSVLNAACLRLRNAWRNRVGDGTELDNATNDLIDLMDRISVFADPICNGDVAKIESAGLEATASSTHPAVNPGRGNTPVVKVSAGGVAEISAKKIAGVSHLVWFIFTNGVFEITVVEGHFMIPSGATGVIIIPEGSLRETLSGFAARQQMHVGNIPVNAAGLGQMSVIVDFNTI